MFCVHTPGKSTVWRVVLTGALALLVAALEVVRAVVGIDTTQLRQ